MYKFIDDRGFFMYDIEQNEMCKVDVDPKDSHLFMRSQHTVNTQALPSTNPKVLKFTQENGMHITNFRHFIFGGEVYSEKEQMRIASHDLIIVE